MKKFLCVLLIIGGLVSIGLSIYCYTLRDGLYEVDRQYGGDAYTGIQNAAAQSANNILYTNEILRVGFCSILVVAGITMISMGGIRLTSENKDNRKDEQFSNNGSTVDGCPETNE